MIRSSIHEHDVVSRISGQIDDVLLDVISGDVSEDDAQQSIREYLEGQPASVRLMIASEMDERIRHSNLIVQQAWSQVRHLMKRTVKPDYNDRFYANVKAEVDRYSQDQDNDRYRQESRLDKSLEVPPRRPEPIYVTRRGRGARGMRDR